MNWKEIYEARAVAYDEAADHLLMAWTEDDAERKQGEYVSRKLRQSAKHYAKMAAHAKETR